MSDHTFRPFTDWTGTVTTIVAAFAFSSVFPLSACRAQDAVAEGRPAAVHDAATDAETDGASLRDAAAKSEPAAWERTASDTIAVGEAVTIDAVKSSIDRAANWLIDHQNADGSYGLVMPDGTYRSDAGVTALALHALAICPRKYREEDGPFISKAVEYLLSQKRDGGGIYEEGQGLRNYKSSMALLALSALDEGRKPRYADEIVALRDYVASLQCAEDSSPAYDPQKNVRAYGGIGYGGDRRPDLSNTQMALEALQAGELAEDSEVFARVQTFLKRCQNREASNDFTDGEEVRSTEDGGFFYFPGESKAGNVEHADGAVSYTSYGSMTYAGVKSLIYAGLKKDDPIVADAVRWLGQNFTVVENPGMSTELSPSRGQMGLFYYYTVMARTLEVLGEKTITDGTGRERRWAAELGGELLRRQSKDGTWTNPVDRWWEGDPALVTAYAIQSLLICARNLKE